MFLICLLLVFIAYTCLKAVLVRKMFRLFCCQCFDNFVAMFVLLHSAGRDDQRGNALLGAEHGGLAPTSHRSSVLWPPARQFSTSPISPPCCSTCSAASQTTTPRWTNLAASSARCPASNRCVVCPLPHVKQVRRPSVCPSVCPVSMPD
jgi:hypothetical protein